MTADDAVRKCWMFCEPEGDGCSPIWGDTLEAAIATTNEWDGSTSGCIPTRIPDWDDRDPDDITKLDWYLLDMGYGQACAFCNEIVFAEVCPVWWTVDGDPVHGPSWETDYCYRDVAAMPQEIYIQLLKERSEKDRVYAAWREANQRIDRLADSTEALREMFEAATGKTPEDYLGIEDGEQI